MAVDVAYARRGGISIAYTVLGEGPTDVVLGCGLISHIDLLFGDPHAYAWLQRLAAGCRLILFDKPGTGLSDPVTGEPTLGERVEDFVAVMDAAGVRRGVVVGLSEAGPPAALLAATQPARVEGLVLLSTLAKTTTSDDYLPHLEDYFAGYVWRWLWHGAEHWGDGAVARAISPWFRDNAVYRALAPSLERACTSPAMARAIISSVHVYDVRDALGSVRVPTLVLGRTEEWVPADAMRDLAERVAGARLELLPGDEHICFWNGDDIADSILRFLDAPPSTSRAADRALLTLVYTDVVGSTSEAAAMGDQRWRWMVARLDEVTEEEVDKHGGRVVKTLGDGALLAFDRPLHGIRCATAIRDRMADADVRIRAAVHAGECELRDDDISGITAHIASRLLDHADAGDVVVSGTVRDLTLGGGLDLEPRDTVELRGVPGRWEVLAVRSATVAGLRPTGGAPTARHVSSADATMTRLDRALVVAARRAPALTRAALAVAGRTRSSRRRATADPYTDPGTRATPTR